MKVSYSVNDFYIEKICILEYNKFLVNDNAVSIVLCYNLYSSRNGE